MPFRTRFIGRPRVGLGVLLLLGVALPYRLWAQNGADTTARPTPSVPAVVAALPPAARIRLATPQGIFTGRVMRRTPDSLTIQTRAGDQVVPLGLVDTLWVPAGKDHTAGWGAAGFGMLLGGLFLLAKGSGEDPGLNQVFAGAAVAGGVVLGLVVDSGGETWRRYYP